VGKLLKWTIAAAGLMIVLVFSACTETNDRELTLGTRANGIYANEYFAFSFRYPQEFSVLNTADIGRMLGLRVYRLSDRETLAQLRMLPLLFADYYHEDSEEAIRSFTLSAEVVGEFRNEAAYLQALVEPWSESDIVFYEDVVTGTAQFSGRTFHTKQMREVAQTADGSRLVSGYRMFFVTRMYGYYVMFAFSDTQNTAADMWLWVEEVMVSFVNE